IYIAIGTSVTISSFSITIATSVYVAIGIGITTSSFSITVAIGIGITIGSFSVTIGTFSVTIATSISITVGVYVAIGISVTIRTFGITIATSISITVSIYVAVGICITFVTVTWVFTLQGKTNNHWVVVRGTVRRRLHKRFDVVVKPAVLQCHCLVRVDAPHLGVFN